MTTFPQYPPSPPSLSTLPTLSTKEENILDVVDKKVYKDWSMSNFSSPNAFAKKSGMPLEEIYKALEGCVHMFLGEHNFETIVTADDGFKLFIPDWDTVEWLSLINEKKQRAKIDAIWANADIVSF
jgi:hypothetical protein